MYEEPLHLVPRHLRKEFSKMLGTEIEAAGQIVMRGDPQSDHRNKDAENAGDHAKCK